VSLNWDITDCDDGCKTDEEWPTTEAIILLTMQVGLGTITEKNIDEFFVRLHVIEAIFGPMVSRNGEPSRISHEDVHRRIGLRVNVTDESKAKWNARVGKILRGRAEGELRTQKVKVPA
jgi:hypothetical protein